MKSVNVENRDSWMTAGWEYYAGIQTSWQTSFPRTFLACRVKGCDLEYGKPVTFSMITKIAADLSLESMWSFYCSLRWARCLREFIFSFLFFVFARKGGSSRAITKNKNKRPSSCCSSKYNSLIVSGDAGELPRHSPLESMQIVLKVIYSKKEGCCRI